MCKGAARNGLAVVATASALGVAFGEGGRQWQKLQAGVEAAYAKVASLPLSALGRGLASASYGIYGHLYHAEFSGLPPAATIQASSAPPPSW